MNWLRATLPIGVMSPMGGELQVGKTDLDAAPTENFCGIPAVIKRGVTWEVTRFAHKNSCGRIEVDHVRGAFCSADHAGLQLVALL